jgi:hypothetical protein
MAISGIFLLGAFVTLPALLAQWIGLVGLRHGGRSGAWWSMATGLALSTLGMASSFAYLLFLQGRWSGHSSLFMIGCTAIPAFGTLLFAIGFAIHGLRSARSASRMRELEQVAAAMSEEINQLRQGRITA